jgi:hypothetical protein
LLKLFVHSISIEFAGVLLDDLLNGLGLGLLHDCSGGRLLFIRSRFGGGGLLLLLFVNVSQDIVENKVAGRLLCEDESLNKLLGLGTLV